MSVESSASNISQLNPNWPTAEDFVSEGDDHLRLLKKTIKQTFPNIKDSVNITDVQLNALSKTVSTEDTGDKLVINGNLTVEKDGYGLIGKADFKLSELTDKTIVNIKMLRELTMPIGHIAILNVATNPRDLYGFGTWAAMGAGRVLVGVGSTTDARGEARSVGLGVAYGQFAHVLTVAEMPAHTHAAGGLVTSTGGSHVHGGNVSKGGFSHEHHQYNGRFPTENWQTTTDAAGDHSHTITGNTASVGSSAAHNISQPSIGVHMWVRTA